MTGYLARIELRQRWRSIALLALLVAVVVGTVLTSVAGARRSRTAYDRYLEAMQPTDVGVFGEDPEALAAAADLPQVESAAPIELLAIQPSERPTEEFYLMMVSVDGQLPYRYMRPEILEGRLPDLDEPLAVALGERTARRLGKGVGDRIPMDSYTPDGVEIAFSDGGEAPEPDGPAFDLEVVGLVRDAGDIASRETDLAFTFITPSFRERFPADQVGVLGIGSFIALDDAPGALNAFAAAAAPLGLEVDPGMMPSATRAQADPTMAAIATGLYVFAAVVAVAGAVAVAQVMSRGMQRGVADDRTLEALGVRRAGRWGGLAAPRAVAIVVGAAGGVVLAVAASPIMPVGLARRAEPETGFDIDVAALGIGFAVALVVLLGLLALTTALSLRAARAQATIHRPSWLARAASDVGAPPSATMGLSFAAGGRSPSSPATRAALAGVVAGVLGLVAAVVFATSMDRLVETPRLYGWGWDAALAGTDLSHVPEGAEDRDRLLADPDIESAAEVVFQLEATVDGSPEFATVLDDHKGHIEAVMVRGDQPLTPDEVALGGETLADTGKQIGDVVAIDLGDGPADLRISGITALPVPEDGGSSTTGVLMARSAAYALGFAGDCEDDQSCYRNIAVNVRAGADPAEVLARHTSEDKGIGADLPMPPGEVERLVAVEQLPWFLAGFLALLATLAIGHSAATAVRRRRRDLAVLRVIGFTGRQVRAVVTIQVATLALAGSLVGAIGGLVVGRQVWRTVVDSVPLPFSPATPAVAVVAVVLTTLLLAQLAAAMPRRAAGRLQTADALRAE